MKIQYTSRGVDEKNKLSLMQESKNDLFHKNMDMYTYKSTIRRYNEASLPLRSYAAFLLSTL